MKILVIGANSAIAQAFSRLYASAEHTLYLVGRHEEKLEATQQDLQARGAAEVFTATADFADESCYQYIIDKALEQLGRFDLVVMAHSILGEQSDFEQDVSALMDLYRVNTLSSLAMLTQVANQMESQRSGNIVFISSVAGDRGRPSNYVYGSSKAAVTAFLQGMNARMAKVGVHVMTVKPGFVKTPMTEHLDTDGPLWATPEKVARLMKKGLEKKRNTLYTPWFWLPIMLIIQHIPTFIFKKLSL